MTPSPTRSHQRPWHPRFAAACLLALAGAGPLHAAPLIQETFNAGSAIDSQTAFEGAYPGSPGARVNGNSTGGAFTVRTQSSNYWQYATTGGTNSGGGLAAPGGQNINAVHNTGFAGFAPNRDFTLEIDTRLRTNNSSSSNPISFRAFLTGSTDPTAATALDLTIAYVTGTSGATTQYTVSANGVPLETITIAGSASGQTNNWYRWSAAWSRDEGDGKYDLALTMYDIGSAGTAAPTLVDSWALADITSATAGSATLYAGLGGRARDNLGIFFADNLSVDLVPEPASLALLALGGLLTLPRRRA